MSSDKKFPQPPKWTTRLLCWLHPHDTLEEVEGDLEELYAYWYNQEGKRRADLRYLWAVLSLLPPFIRRRKEKQTYSTPFIFFPSMLLSYLVIASRTLWRNRLYTVLNVCGLASGISACLIIFLIAHFEISFDHFHPDRDRIYRVYTQYNGLNSGTNRGVAGNLPFAISQTVRGVENTAPFYTHYSLKVSVDKGEAGADVYKDQSSIVVAGPEYFTLFEAYEWIEGAPQIALDAPFRVVLTKSRAQMYFGLSDARQAIGRTLHYNDSLTVTVSGIVEDLPKTTDFDFTDFISFATIEQSWLKSKFDPRSWQNMSSAYQCFIKLEKGVKAESVEKQLEEIALRHLSHNEDLGESYRLQALSEIHFDEQAGIFDRSRIPVGEKTLKLLTGIALLILLIAAINFINLVTAQGVKRAKEVGIRKVLGSTRRQLLFGFMGETLLVTSFAVVLSLLLTKVALGLFSDYIPKGVALEPLQPVTIGFLVSTIVVVSALSGFYPAVVLSSYNPVRALKNVSMVPIGKTRSAFLRHALIVFQFAVAQVLIMATFVINAQISFMLNKELGFREEAVVVFPLPHKGKDGRESLRGELQRLPGIEMISLSMSPPLSGSGASRTLKYDNGKEIVEAVVEMKLADTSYIHLYNIPLLAGRNLKADKADEYLINETYARQLGFSSPEQALGGWLSKKYSIVGVVKDFHISSLHEPIKPLIISYDSRSFYSFNLRLSQRNENFSQTLGQVEKIWKRFYPDTDFTYHFLDDRIAEMYQREQNTRKLAAMATSMAIFISCLGLFGLATYTAVGRTKEIGIRKVLGASISEIVLLLSRNFFFLILLANLIACPIGWYLMKGWLEDFAFHIPIHPYMFISTGMLALLIALLTIGYQSIKAAMANPVKTLRTE